MANYEDDDDLNDVEENESPAEETEGGAAPSNGNNRNFLLALGVLGGIFVIAIIALVLLILNRRPGTTAAANISATNQAILLANTQTAGAATQAAGILLTPSITPLATETPIPLTPTNTQVLALATATSTPLAGQSGQLLTVTPNLQTRTATIGALLTQSAQQTLTRTAAARLTGTATKLPSTGFAEDVGLPGLFGLSIGLVVVIVLVRRLRFSTGG